MAGKLKYQWRNTDAAHETKNGNDVCGVLMIQAKDASAKKKRRNGSTRPENIES